MSLGQLVHGARTFSARSRKISCTALPGRELGATFQHAGIQPAFKASAKLKTEASADGASAKDTESISDYVKGFALSVPVGLSYEYEDFVFDARYNLGVTKAFKDNNGLDADDSKHSWFMFTLGYKFAL
jgi:hypothetical protein